MADNPLVGLMDHVAGAVDWIHETFADPELSKALREDLGITTTSQGTLPTGEKIRLRHPNGDPVDVNKAAFDATVAEVKAAYGLLADFFASADLSLDELWDVLAVLSRVGAAASVRERAPDWVYFGLVALGMIGSGEDAAAVDILRAVDLLGGRFDIDPVDNVQLWEGLRNWVGFVSAVLLEI
ncbi:MAG TPA: hypothetical protein VI300_06425, partial [Solirubrobacter sp.]